MDRPKVVPRRSLFSPPPAETVDPLWVPKPKPRVKSPGGNEILIEFQTPIAKPRRSLKRKQVDLEKATGGYDMDPTFRNSWAQQIKQFSNSHFFKGNDTASGGEIEEHTGTTELSGNDDSFTNLDYGEIATESKIQQSNGYFSQAHLSSRNFERNSENSTRQKYPNDSNRYSNNHIETHNSYKKRRKIKDDSLGTFPCAIL